MLHPIHPEQILKSERGVSMVNVMFALSLLALFALVAAGLANNERRTAFNDGVHTRAFVAADAGGEQAIAWLRQQQRPPTITDLQISRSVNTLFDQTMYATEVDGEFDYDVGMLEEDEGKPIRPRAGYDPSLIADFYYSIDSQGHASSTGESNVGLVVSKLTIVGY